MTWTVGFDLDLTLIDTSSDIVQGVTHVCEMHGVTPDPEALRLAIGTVLVDFFAETIPGIPYSQLVAEYRAYITEHLLERTRPMPCATEALAAVHANGGRSIVVTAKKHEMAVVACAAAGLADGIDVLVGDRYAEAKGEVLLEQGAILYVGDHPADMVAATHAGTYALGVAAGPTTPDELYAAGADHVLANLCEFPAWLAQWRAQFD